MISLKDKPFYLNDEDILWVNKTLESMTIDEKIEHLFCPLSFTNDPNILRGIISKYNFGGMMFRPGDAEETQGALKVLQENSRIPLLLAANLEDGGNGIAVEGTYMGRQMLISATGDTNKAYELGKICGREGKAIGINWSFAPVVDIDYNFRNPITNVRTYGSDSDKVLEMAKGYMKGISEEGLIVSIKHFPGDGVDERDQHLLTSVNSLSLDEWEESYGQIYKGLIEEGTMTVMVGHIAMPAMEEYFNGQVNNKVIPASLSKNITKNWLRGKMGFNGLISTDASPMVGFACAMDRKKAVPTAIENGCDMFLFTRDLEEDIEYMKDGYREGILSDERLNEAVIRILATKASMKLYKKKEDGTINLTKEELKILKCEEHLKWAKEAADMGITLVKDTQKLLPLDVNKHKRVLLELIGDFDSNERVYNQFEGLLKNEGFKVERYLPETLENIFSDAKVQDFRNKYDLVIYIGNIENSSNKTVSRINWHTLFGAGNNLPWFVEEVPTLFISVGNPYHLFDVPMIKTYINGYCHSPYVIESVVEKIMGRSEFKGINPIDPFCGRRYLRY